MCDSNFWGSQEKTSLSRFSSINKNSHNRMTSSKRRLLGYGMMLVFLVCWTASAVSVQLLERKVPDFQLGAIRYIGSAVCSLIPIFILKVDFKLPKELWSYVLLLALISMFYVIPLFGASAVLPVTHAACVPLVFTIIAIAVISKLAFRESISLLTLLTIFGCILGTTLLVQPWNSSINGFIPGFINTTSDTTKTYNLTSSNDHPSDYNISMTIFGYFCLALAGTFDAFGLLVGGVLAKTGHAILGIFIMSVLNIPVCGLLSIYMEEAVLITNSYTLLLVFIHMITSGAGLVALYMALQYITPAQAGIIQILGAVFNLIPQYTFLSAHLSGRMNVLEVAGCIVIILSIVSYELKSTVLPHEDFQ